MKKQPENTLLEWAFLFEHNRGSQIKLKPAVLELLNSETKLFNKDFVSSIPNKPLSGIYFFYSENSKLIDVGKSEKNLREALRFRLGKLSGTGHSMYVYAVAVLIPRKLLGGVWEYVRELHIREQMKDSIGEELMAKEFLDDTFIKECVERIAFTTICSRNTLGEPMIHDVESVRIDASCIYCLREHDPKNPHHAPVVYVGKSFGRAKMTIKDHYRDWKKKSEHYSGNSRPEDRGDYLRKIREEGFWYSVGIIQLVPPASKNRHSKWFGDKIKACEKRFIFVLDPPHNGMGRKTEPVEEDPF